MSLTRKVAHNSIIQFAGKAIGTVLALVTISMMLRYLGPEGFGEYTTAINFLSVFAIIVDMGLYLVVTREISKEETDQNKFMSNAFTLRLILAVVIMSLAPMVVLLFPYTQTTKMAVLVGALSFVFISLIQITIGIFQKSFRMEKVAVAEVLGRVVWLVGVYLAMTMGLNLLYIMAFISLSSAINFILVFLFSKKFVKIGFAFDFKLWKKILKYALPLAVAVVLNLVYFKAGVLILSVMKPVEEVGIYGAAQKVLENLVTFSAIFAGLLLPVFSRYVYKEPEKFKRIFRKGFDVLIMFVIPMIVGTLFLAEPLIVLFGGEEFRESAVALKGLIFPVGAIFFGNLFGNVIVAANQQRKIVYIYAVCVVLALGISFFFIPKYSYMGAVASTLVTEFIVAISMGFVIYRVLKIRPEFKVFFKSMVAALFMAGILFVMPESWNLFVRILFAAGVYFGVLYVLQGINREIIREVVRIRET